MTGTERRQQVRALWHDRPRRPFWRRSMLALLALILWSLWTGGFVGTDVLSERRLASVARFVSELTPYPLRESGVSVSGWLAWAGDLWAQRGQTAALSTLSISVVAIILAAGLGALLTLGATRTLATAEPYLPSGRRVPGTVCRAWRLLVFATRMVLALLRAIPEYVWVFVLIGVLGPTPWAAILALALHNGGILGRLNAEVIEDLEPERLAALRATGAGRLQIAGWGVAPLALPRLLLFFFYRWESCVREATVLGLLGIVSIGFWIQDARARQQPDTMLFFILVGALLVVLGDLLSALARRWVRDGR